MTRKKTYTPPTVAPEPKQLMVVAFLRGALDGQPHSADAWFLFSLRVEEYKRVCRLSVGDDGPTDEELHGSGGTFQHVIHQYEGSAMAYLHDLVMRRDGVLITANEGLFAGVVVRSLHACHERGDHAASPTLLIYDHMPVKLAQ